MTEPVTANADPWPDHIRLSDIEHRFVCEVCGLRGADVRPDFNWSSQPTLSVMASAARQRRNRLSK